MAKKKAAIKTATGVSKSKAVRTYLAQNPATKPKQVAEALTKQFEGQGVAFTPAFVSQIKIHGKKMDGVKPKVAEATSIDNKAIVAAVLFVRAVGGLKQAEAALEVIGALEGLNIRF